jgi:hypothetical protein
LKHDKLRSIAHNVAYSLASGESVMIGVFDVNVFAEARTTSNGSLTVDFVSGKVLDGETSKRLAEAVRLFREVLPSFCKTHGASIEDFREFGARYHADSSRFLIMIEDQRGKRSSTEYDGFSGRRALVTDGLGRVRKKRSI